MPSHKTTFLSPTELAFIRDSLCLTPPIRPDARAPTAFRPLVAEIDLLPSTNGSARLCFGDGTEGIVGVKAEVERTKRAIALRDNTDTDQLTELPQSAEESVVVGDNGWVELTIDLPGQRDDDATANTLSQTIYEGLVADGILPVKLHINDNWHWKLYIDILLISQASSYPLPLLSLATHLALLSTRLPALISRGLEDPHFDDDWEAAVPLYPKADSKGRESTSAVTSKPPISIVVAVVESHVFFDPSREELAVADAVLAVTITQANDRSTRVLAVRTLEPPSTSTISSSSVLAGEPGFGAMDEGEGVWKPKRGGVKRGVLIRAIKSCTEKGGVGEEILSALEAFV